MQCILLTAYIARRKRCISSLLCHKDTVNACCFLIVTWEMYDDLIFINNTQSCDSSWYQLHGTYKQLSFYGENVWLSSNIHYNSMANIIYFNVFEVIKY